MTTVAAASAKTENPYTAKSTSSTESKASLSSATASTDFNSFLTLLTTQLRNQDPLNPQDSTQFVQQLATFSSVEQQIESNRLLEGISASLGGSDLLNAGVDWVGRNVEATTDQIAYKGKDVSLVIPAAKDGAARDVVIRDAEGAEVFRQPAGSKASNFVWNGKDEAGRAVAEGRYGVALESAGEDGKTARTPLAVQARVEEARLVDGSVQLMLDSGVAVATSAVRAVLKPQG
ncbi:MAG: hypothetical protein K2Q06_04895 [Parvularculaceae bacterium]|nr:hypothetical protein [Parvularculaceae bacterium]